MLLRIGYVLLFLGFVALVGQTLNRLSRERQFYELQLRQQADSIESGLQEKWRNHLLQLARQNQLSKDYFLLWDRTGRKLLTDFYPKLKVELAWDEYRNLANKKQLDAQKVFLSKAMARLGSWDRILAIEEWLKITEDKLPIAPVGYERTLMSTEALHAFQDIFSVFEMGRDFTFVREEADFERVFFRSNGQGAIEGYLPSIESVRAQALPGFLKSNSLDAASFGQNALDIHFPQVIALAGNGITASDTLLYAASAAFLALGILLTALGVRSERKALLHRVSFLNQVVHELKTPLAGLKLNAQLIRKSGPQERNLQAIDESVMRLDRLFDDIVQINRPSAAAPLERISAEDVNELIARLCEEYPQAHFVNRAEHAVKSETGRLRLLLRNLISNGIKYGDAVEVKTKAHGGNLRIEIKDKGPGIAPSEAKKIFGEFYRSESAKKLKVDGLGLGLSLVKKIENEIGATVILENPGSPGALFSVVLPLAKDEKV